MSKKLNIGYFADGPWSHKAFNKLIDDNEISISFVCVRFDTQDSTLKQYCKKYKIDYLKDKNINSTEFIDKISKYHCNLFISMSFNQIFKNEIINLTNYKIINCHAGKLPFYRGRNILNWALINDESEFGITVHYVHGEYYVDYMENFSSSISKPLVFHDAPLSNNIGLPENYLSQVMSINRVDGIKAHSPDPCSIHTIYNMFSKSKLCFDGFGKTLQFWSLKWGANARHTCWSWFDSNSDQDFFNSMAGSDYKRATDIIEREWKLAKEIKKTGFAGYKEIMRINGQIPNNLTRIPGLRVSKSEASDLYSSYNKYKNSIEL